MESHSSSFLNILNIIWFVTRKKEGKNTKESKSIYKLYLVSP
jgi:hypothetical protein